MVSRTSRSFAASAAGVAATKADAGRDLPRANRLTVVLMFLLPMLAAFGPLLPGIGSFFLFRLAALLFFIVAVVTHKKDGRSSLRNLTVTLAVGWFFVATLGLLVSGISSNTWSELLTLVSGLALLLGIVLSPAPRQLLMVFLGGWLFAYFIVSTFALVEIVTGFSLSASYAEERSLDAWGITVMFYNPNNYATFLLFSYLALLVLWGRARTTLTRVLAVCGILSIPLFMAATSSRTGVLILAVFVAVTIFLVIRRNLMLRVVFVLVVIVAVIFVLQNMSTPNAGLARVVGDLGYAIDLGVIAIPVDVSTFVRWNLVLVGLSLAGANPLLGGGAGSYEDYVTSSGMTSQTLGITNPHNGFIEVLSQYGIVMFALFVIWLLGVLVTGARARRKPDRPARVVWIAILLGIVSLPLVLTMHSSAIDPSTTWVFFGFLLLAARVEESQPAMRPTPGAAGRRDPQRWKDIDREYRVGPKSG